MRKVWRRVSAYSAASLIVRRSVVPRREIVSSRSVMAAKPSGSGMLTMWKLVKRVPGRVDTQ